MRRRRRDSLLGQVLAANVLLVAATLFGASLVASLDLNKDEQRWQFLVLAWGILLTLLVNFVILRRRFAPLEQLIEEVEQIDPSKPPALKTPESRVDEIDRLAVSFRGLLERIEGERRRSGMLVLRAQEEERKRIARDLHDEVNQALTAILLRLEALSQDAPPQLADELAETKRLATQAMEELLQLARQLRPTALDDHGIVPAIESQVKRFSEQSGIAGELRTRGQPTGLTDDQQIVLYRVVQEALSNVGQHAAASRVALDLVSAEGYVTVRVRDDGRGFDDSSMTDWDGGSLNGVGSGRLGLNGMAERARLVGGDLRIVSAPGRGTVVTLRFPQRALETPAPPPAGTIA
jgi:two-component system, NarL family, sensor histidine kinase UhpB